MASKLNTKFAPAERANREEIERQIAIFRDNAILNEFLNKVPSVFLILNRYRQIVYMNNSALEFTGLGDITSIIGKRPGETFGCIHSNEEAEVVVLLNLVRIVGQYSQFLRFRKVNLQ